MTSQYSNELRDSLLTKLKKISPVSLNMDEYYTTTIHLYRGIPRYSVFHLALFRYSALAYP
jgi:hypothetical protein